MFKLAAAAAAVSASSWSHADQDAWVAEHPTCGSPMQSPIDLVDAIPKSNGKLPNLQMDFPDTVNLVAENTGHDLKFQLNDTTVSTLSGGMLGNVNYQLQQFHIHWKSEHKINGDRKDAEIHFVHLAEDMTMDKADSLAVVGVMVKKGKKNKELQTILDSISDFTGYEGKKAFSGVQLKKFLPGKVEKDFYFYRGSLTTPPCYQSVQWYVARQHITMSSKQIKLLQTLLDSEDVPIEKNYRQEQKLNARSVFRSFSTGAEDQAEMDDLLEQFAGVGR